MSVTADDLVVHGLRLTPPLARRLRSFLPSLSVAKSDRDGELCALIVALDRVAVSTTAALPYKVPDPVPVIVDPVTTRELRDLIGTENRQARNVMHRLGAARTGRELVVERQAVNEYLTQRASRRKTDD